MSLLQVRDRGDGIQVVDSRLIAAELGIEHKNLLATLEKYKSQIEQAFGVVAFETLKPIKSSAGGRPEHIAYLTENQATLLMTFSRNTERVVDCKVALVKAFDKAKRVITAQAEEMEKLRLMVELAKTQERLAASTQTLETIAPGLGQLVLGRTDVTVERVVTVEHHAIVDARGQIVHEHTGQSPTTVAKSLGMKAAKDLKSWLESIDRLDLPDGRVGEG